MSEKEDKAYSRRQFLKMAGVAGAAVGLGGGLGGLIAACGGEAATTTTGGATTTAAAGKTGVIKIGLNCPLSGASAAWGLPGTEGLEIWMDWTNASPPQIGDTKYTFELVKYDNEYVGSKALLGARKLVEQDGVSFILDLGGDTSASMVPYLTEKKMMSFTLIAQDLQPDRPYLYDVTDNFPTYHITDLVYMKKAHPELKTMAILSQDDTIGIAAAAWAEAGAETLGLNIAYDKSFSVETTDFAPIVTTAIASKPDIINLGACYPEFQALICEQAYLQGWKGLITSACWDFGAILAKVPKEFMEGAVSNFPYFNDPGLVGKATIAPAGGKGHTHLEFWDEWKKRFPGHGYSEIVWEYMSACDVWVWAAQKAGSIVSEEVSKTLESSEDVPHTLGGPGDWLGKDFFGIDHLLAPTLPITEIQSGEPKIVDWLSVREWLETSGNKDILNKYLKKWNLAK
jgi:branched-chain amino acid transport system substrate-binding protein